MVMCKGDNIDGMMILYCLEVATMNFSVRFS